MAREHFAREAQRAHIERLAFAGAGVLEPAVGAERGDQRAAGGIGIGVIDRAELGRAPGFERGGEFAVARLEKRPVEIAAVGHQSPSNSGLRLSTKAW